jgi:hypothetical protein
VSPVSDFELRSDASAVEQAMAELADYRNRARDRVHALPGDEQAAVREAWKVQVFELDLLEERMLGHLRQRTLEVTPAGLPRRPGAHRPVGEDTQAWRTGQAYMPRNRGPV